MKCEMCRVWRSMRNTLMPALLLTVAIGCAARLDAAVIYSNLGPNDSFSTSPGTYPIWNLTSGGFIERAAAFTVPGSQNVQFGSADLGFHLQTGTSSANVKLAADASGNVPGTIIESINISLPPPSANPTIVTATSNTNPTLIAGNTYWIIASVNFPGTMATWGPNTTNTPGGNATRTNFQNGQWFAQPSFGQGAMRISSLEVPEPATCALVAFGLAAAVGTRRYWRRA
jgi:PEP-CTERM motif